MMHDFFGLNPLVCERLTITLLHFLWQGAAIGVVAAVLSRMLLWASSQLRYMIHVAALVAMCCCLPITFSLVTVPEPVAVASATIDDRPVSNPSFPLPVIDANPILRVPNDSSEPAGANVLPGQPISPQKTLTVVMTNSGEADSDAARYLPRLAPYVTAIYLAGVALLLVRLMRSAWLTRRLARSATVVTDIDVLYRMRTKAERLGLRVLPALRWCHKVPVPVVIGVLRPMVLLPAYAATGLTMDRLQAVMAHELAHIRRHDLVVNVLQRVIESLLFFHPAVWWVSQQIANEREQACDELVLTVGPGRAQYADALVRMAELSCQFGQLPVTALATTGSSPTAFKRRVLKVLEIDPPPKIRPSRIAAVTASMVVLLTLAMLLSSSGALASGGTGEDQNRPQSSSEEVKQANLVPNDQPTTQPTLQMDELPGTYYNGGDVVLAHIGYTPPVPDAWMNWLDKDATTSLEKLPVGKHWLIAKHPWTVFPVELPLATSPLKQQPRAGLPPQKHGSNQYFAVLTSEFDKAEKEFIRVDVKNMTDESLSFCELDLTLGAGWDGAESDAHSPLWMTEKLHAAPRINIPARESSSFRIDWADWVRRGVWDPMSGVQTKTRPTLPEQQPGKIWVRMGGPGFGTLPVAVTRPEQLLAAAGLKAERGELAEAADGPHFELQVVDEVTRQPIAGADVRVRHYVSVWQPNNVTPSPLNDFNNRFRTVAKAMFPITFPAEMQGLMQYLQVSVRHPDYVTEQSFGARQVTAELAADPVLAREKLFPGGVISLKRGFEVSGQVLLPDGKPAWDVAVYAAWQMPDYLNMPPHAETDVDGRYKFRTLGGSSDENHLMFIPEFHDPTAEAKPKAVDLALLAQAGPVAQSIPMQETHGEHPVVRLQSGTRITGVVRDAAGNALSNVVVQANGSDSVYTGFPNVMACVVTDADGRYVLPAQLLPVDVRVARWGGLGGWSLPRQVPKDVYAPQLVTADWFRLHSGGENLLVADFNPVTTVTLRARAFGANGQPNPLADILLMAHVPLSDDKTQEPGPLWMRRFEEVPGEAGLYELKVPQGLIEASIDLTGEGLKNPAVTTWSRVPHADANLKTQRTNSPWPILDRDDDSIIIGEPARPAESAKPADTDGNTDENSSPKADSKADLNEGASLERTISLKLDNLSRRQTLQKLAEAAGLEVIFDEVSLAKTDFDLEKPMSVDFVDEPLWQTVRDVCELPSIISAGPVAISRQNQLIITTMEAEAIRQRTPLPEWLSVLQSHGVGGTTDDDGEVNRVSIGENGLTDDVLTRLPELEHLTELTIDPRGPAADAALAQFSKLHSLESLTITSGETTSFRTDQLLAHIKSLPNLKSV